MKSNIFALCIAAVCSAAFAQTTTSTQTTTKAANPTPPTTGGPASAAAVKGAEVGGNAGGKEARNRVDDKRISADMGRANIGVTPTQPTITVTPQTLKTTP